MENYDDSFEGYNNSYEDFNDTDGVDYSDYDDYGSYPRASKSDSYTGGCLNFALWAIGIVFGIGMLFVTLVCLVPKGDKDDIVLGFAISAIGLLSLWLSCRRDKLSMRTLITVIINDIFK